jgi:hypothetical protein
MSLETFLENITIEELEELKRLKESQSKIKSYSFSKITYSELNSIVDIKRLYDYKIFNNWFDNSIKLLNKDEVFLQNLIEENIFLIHKYKEEDLKVKFLTPILNRIKFLDFGNNFRDFYNEKLLYESEIFILNGETDFLVANGLEYSQKPYFFIQEFKKSQAAIDPEPQLLAELIAAVELNNWSTIKGAYIVGSIWNFVILERLERHKYQYYVSQNFDSVRIDDLKGIYKNLLFVKNEIIEMIKNGE